MAVLMGLLSAGLIGAACLDQADTLLTAAAIKGDLAQARALLARGADPDGKDSHGWTPLQCAARHGRLDVIEALLKTGADPNLRDSAANRWTPLMHAIHKGQNKAARLLLDAGAEVDARAGNVTALLMAAGYGNTEMVRELLDRGADPRAEAAPGLNALWAAAGGGAIADITDGPPLGTCFPDTVKAIHEKAPDLRLKPGLWTRAVRLLGRSKECRQVFELVGAGRS